MIDFDCPRCHRPVKERFYGPCGVCQDELRAVTLFEPEPSPGDLPDSEPDTPARTADRPRPPSEGLDYWAGRPWWLTCDHCGRGRAARPNEDGTTCNLTADCDGHLRHDGQLDPIPPDRHIHGRRIPGLRATHEDDR